MPAPPEPSTATLLVSCPDQPGIVATLAQVLYGHGANILDADQHTDAPAGIFFQRIRFDTAQLRTDRTSLKQALEEVAERLQMRWQLAWAGRPQRVAVFVSRTDHCLHDLLLRHRAGELDCEIPLVLSNHEQLAPVAAQYGIDYHVFPITPDTKAAQEEREAELLEAHRIDLLVLARYMQVLSTEMVRRFESRIINIHHSFLPAFSRREVRTTRPTRGV